MRVVVLSDTHLAAGRPIPVDIARAVEGAEVVLHAGDVTSRDALEQLGRLAPVEAVLGNNDHELVGALPERLELDLGGVRVALVHDSGPAAGRAPRLRRWFPDADLVVFGHSHLPLHAEGEDGQVLLNPGSPTQRRRAPTRTLAELRIDGGHLAEVRVIDLGV